MPPDPSASGHTRLPGPLALPNDDPRKIVAVAVILCLVCSVMVSSAAVLLKPQQERNQALAIRKFNLIDLWFNFFPFVIIQSVNLDFIICKCI